jgi:ABC-type glycerol-3-phosphate transport system permease component
VRTKRHRWLGLFGIVLFTVVFLVPFAFILFTAAKTQTEAGALQFSLPTTGRCSRTLVTRSAPATTCWSSPSSTAPC